MLLVNSSALASGSLSLSIADNELLSGAQLSREYMEQTITKYSEEDAAFEAALNDPTAVYQDEVSDDELFGVWDDTAGEWSVEPLLDYDEYRGLLAVQEAAKSGDIPLAKAELLDYYESKFDSTDLGYSPTTSKANLNIARMYLENIVTELAVADVISLTDEFTQYQIDVTANLKGIASVAGKRAEFLLTGLRKDGNMGLFYTNESTEDRPYIVLTVDGRVTAPYYPIADTYIQAGNYAYDCYGDESVMLVEESYSTIGDPMPARTDSYTKRAAMLFDFSDINANSSITSATLYLTGKMMPSDNPTAPETLPAYKDIVVLQGTDLQWSQDTHTWDTASTSDFKSYNGEYNYEISGSLAIDPLKTGIQVYLGTGDETYAYHAVRMITTAMANMLTIENGIDGQISLAISQSVADLPNMIAELSRIPYMTPEKFALIMKYVYLTAQRSVTQWSNQDEGNNFGNVNSAAVMIAALAYPEFKVVRAPLENDGNPVSASLPGSYMGGWKAVGEKRVLYTAELSLFPDGSCKEVSFSYVKYILNAYTRLFAVISKLGINAKDVIAQEVLDCFEKYLLYLTNMSNPREKGGGWQQGDDSAYTTAAISSYGDMVEIIDNPIINWMYSGKKQGEAPSYLSYAYDDAVKAVLRSGWDTQAVAAQINADAGKNSHGHSDDMSLNVHAYGRMLLVDPLYESYDSTDPISAWLYATRAHNTIEINDTTLEGSGRNTTRDITYTTPDGKEETIYAAGECAKGDITNREFNKMYNFIRAQSNGYEDHGGLSDSFTTYRDVLFIEPEYFIVTDYIEPKRYNDVTNKVAQYWHTLPEAGLMLDSSSGSVKTNFETGANIIITPVKGTIPTQSAIKWGWYQSQNNPAEYVKYEKNAAGKITFNTVLYPLKAQENKEVSTQSLTLDVTEGEASAAKVTITDNNTGNVKVAHYYNLHDLSKKAERAFGDYKTDAELSFVQKAEDSYEKLIIRNGTKVTLSENDEALLQSASTVSDLGIVWNVDELSLSTSKDDITYSDIKIYAPNATKVFLNDEEITFARDGNYIIPTSSGTIAPVPTPPAGGEETPTVPEHGSGSTNTDTSGNQGSSSDSGSGGGGGGGGKDKIPYPSIPTTDVPTGTPQLPQAQMPFKVELSGHWAESEITKMVDAELINGDGKGNLNLKNAVTRAEFITLLVRALKLGEKPYQGGFSDVSGGEWYASYLATAKENRLLEGSGGRALPNDVITREQMAKMLVSACEMLGKTADAEDVTYTDFAAVSDWAKEFVQKASALGILNGFEDGSFSPKGNVLREQAFVAVYRLVY